MEFFDPSLQGLLWVLAICVTVIIADVFFETEVLSVLALLGVAIYVALLFDVGAKWWVLIAFLCWLVMTALFYVVWKRLVAPLLKKALKPGIEESIHQAVGSIGEYRLIDQKPFVYWNGDLWPVDESPGEPQSEANSMQDHQQVRIASVTNGIFTVSKVN